MKSKGSSWFVLYVQYSQLHEERNAVVTLDLTFFLCFSLTV